MRNLLALLLFAPSLCIAQSVTLPYNPDANADSAIGAPDLLEFLPHFGGYFTPEPILVDGQTLEQYIENLESALAESESDTVALPMLPGTEPGQMLYWDGSQWTLVPAGSAGEFLGTDGAAPSWQSLPLDGTLLEVGCADQTACNYDPDATVNYEALCIYEDECGICDGPGAIYGCGCHEAPPGFCDCDGNQLDALNVCGGTCEADVDGDGICDDGDDCIGEADECGVCNGPGAIYECGCTGIAPDECDCAGTPDEDQDGICDTEDPCIGIADSDGDGICDDVDDCDGTYDICGVCNGPGPIYDCGCYSLPDSICDCAGNAPDSTGTCPDFAFDTDGDGILDSIADPCLGQTHFEYHGVNYGLLALAGRCWFRDNLDTEVLSNGDSIALGPQPGQPGSVFPGYWNVNGDDSTRETYGLVYNQYAATNYRGLCPSGFEVPTRELWVSLIEELGGQLLAGAHLKQGGTDLWMPPNSGATNSSGFSALPAGEHDITLGHVGVGEYAYFWSSSDSSYINDFGSTTSSPVMVQMDTWSTEARLQFASAKRGMSVRCISSPPVLGCTEPNYFEYNPEANVNDGSCIQQGILGCTDPLFAEYTMEATLDDGSCQNLLGCGQQDSLYYYGYNYDLTAVGNDCWFAENLRSSHFRNGDPILLVTDHVQWASGQGDYYCFYNNDTTHTLYQGYFYNSSATNDSRGVCPSGWHVSSDADWQAMESLLGMPEEELATSGNRGQTQIVGTQIKDISFNGTDVVGLSVKEGGYRNATGFYSNNYGTQLQSPGTSSSGGFSSTYRKLQSGAGWVYRSASCPACGRYIRCVRNKD